MTREEVDALRARFAPESRLVLEKMEGEPQMPDGLRGKVTHVDDIGQVHVRWENGSSLALDPERDRYVLTPPADKIHAIYVQPGEPAREILMEDTLEEIQKLVGGFLEEYYPFDDDAVILCNEEGKLLGLEPNRSFRGEDGKVLDVVCGSFLIVRAEPESERYSDLTPAQIRKYLTQFRIPEYFVEVQTGARPVFRDLSYTGERTR